MKRIAIISLILTLIFYTLSCSFEAPSSVSVKASGRFNYTIGTFARSLSEDLSIDTIDSTMNKNSKNKNYTVYEYNPGGKSDTLQFVIEYYLHEVPLDIGEYLGNIDLGKKIKNTSIHQKVDVPSLNVTEAKQTVKVPDINEKIITGARFFPITIPLPKGINGSLPNGLVPLFPVNIAEPAFNTFEFFSGSVDIVVSEKENDSDLVTSLTVSMLSSDGKTVISKKEKVNLQKEKLISLPIKNTTLTPHMFLKVEGKTQGGQLGEVAKYTVSLKFNNNTKLKKATGLTMDLGEDGNVPIKQKVWIKTDEAFVSCIIGDKSEEEKSVLTIKASPFPEDWSGFSTVKNINIRGAIEAQDREFSKNNEEGNNILDRYLLLKGRKYSKGDIEITGSVIFTLNNATITTKDGKIDDIEISTDCKITKMAAMTIDLSKSNTDFNDTISYNEKFYTDEMKCIKQIQFEPSGMDVKYKNTLPPGNDIKLKMDSNFFNVHGKEGVIKATGKEVANKEGEGKGEEGKEGEGEATLAIRGEKPALKVIDENSMIDTNVKIILPGENKNSKYATFTNLEIEGSYTLDIEVTPTFDWEYAVIDINKLNTAMEDYIDTGLSFSEMFSSLTDLLKDEEFVNRIDLVKVPLYLYSVVPDIKEEGIGTSLSDRISFKGVFSAGIYDKNGIAQTKQTYILGEEGKPALVNSIKELPSYKLDSEDVVINELNAEGAAYGEMQDLFNSHAVGSVRMNYNFTIMDSSGQEGGIKLYKKDVDKNKEESAKKEEESNKKEEAEAEGKEKEETIGIKLIARFVLPLYLEVVKDKDGSENPLSLNLANVIYDTPDTKTQTSPSTEPLEDILGRSEKTDTKDFDKYIDLIKEAGLSYKMNNNYVKYDEKNKDLIMQIDSKVESIGEKGIIESVVNKDDSVKFTKAGVRGFLDTYPFHPDLYLLLPLGKLRIPRGARVGMNINLYIDAKGKVKLF